MPMRVEMEGMDEAIRKINELGSKGEAIERKALQEAGDRRVEQFKAAAPKGDTGNLIDSITKTEVKNGEVEVGPSSDGFYGKFIEFGFYNKRVKRQIPPRPWMGPAFERQKPAINMMMASAIKKELGI